MVREEVICDFCLSGIILYDYSGIIVVRVVKLFK